MYSYDTNNKTVNKLDETTFKELNMTEGEELLRLNIDMICEEEEDLLIVGQQVRNEENGRSDLTAIDGDGNLVLIEIKRDIHDIEQRSKREPFEFQAIRYAASCASIKTTEELVQDIFVNYIKRHENDKEFNEYRQSNLTHYEFARRRLEEFMDTNNIKTINGHQRIILVASDFDKQTTSAVAWLASNGIDISCFKICPYSHDKKIYFDVQKILPLAEYEDLYVRIKSNDTLTDSKSQKRGRQTLPRIDDLLEKGIVFEGDVLYPKNKPDNTVVLGMNGKVQVQEGNTVDNRKGEMSLQVWLKGVYRWNSVQTYNWCIQKNSGKTLAVLRQEYLEHESKSSDLESEEQLSS